MNLKRIIALIVILISSLLIYNHKLLEVPTSLTVDEAAFGYNAALLAKTGRDERGLRMPMFVLSINGKDWRQPVTQYYLAGLFKVFGSSLYLLRFSSVIIVLASVWAIYILTADLMGGNWGLVAAISLATMPIMLIQGHLGLDNIMPVPFTILWLWSLFSYRHKRDWRWLALSAFALGISFYSYKGMRAIVPMWLITSVIYLLAIRKNWKEWFKSSFVLGLSFLPFLAIIPYIEKNFSGAILGGANPTWNNFYELAIPYLSSFDLSYLFVRGDALLFHSTGRHGMMLLATLPWILLGIYRMLLGKNAEFKTMLLALVAGPLLYSVVGSEHRYSRLLCMLPLYALTITVGVKHLWENRKTKWSILGAVALLMVFVNFGDFVRYYWKTYPGVTLTLLGKMDYYRDFETLATESRKLNLEPVLSGMVANTTGEIGKFFQVVYFGRLLETVSDDRGAQEGQAMLTQRKEIDGNTLMGTNQALYFVQVPEQ